MTRPIYCTKRKGVHRIVGGSSSELRLGHSHLFNANLGPLATPTDPHEQQRHLRRGDDTAVCARGRPLNANLSDEAISENGNTGHGKLLIMIT